MELYGLAFDIPAINGKKCDGCGTCVGICPQGAIIMPDIAIINADSCVNCKICVNICPLAAIEQKGKNVVQY